MNIRGLTARDITRALKEDGYVLKRTRGSHHIYSRPDGRVIVVPYTNLSDTFPIGTLRQIISAATHEGIRQILRKEVPDPSTVDALALTRVQLEGVYTICYMLQEPSSVTDYVKQAWKKTYSRFLLEQKERERLSRFDEYKKVGGHQIDLLQISSGR